MIEFVPGKNTKRKADVALLLEGQILEHKMSSKDVGLIVNESLNRKEYVEYLESPKMFVSFEEEHPSVTRYNYKSTLLQRYHKPDTVVRF